MSSAKKLSIPDLVTLSLLSEKPMHGYELNSVLENRSVRDWAAISRPQVYYSLKKLQAESLVESESGQLLGPERQVFQVTAKGSGALKEGLAEAWWTESRERPPFLTWLAMSSHLSKQTKLDQISKRRTYLECQLQKEKQQLSEVLQDEGEMVLAAKLMIGFVIASFELELKWLHEVADQLERNNPC